MSQLNLPSTPVELRNAIKLAIEHFQGSPVKNENKLNESLAKALNFNSYDQLAPYMVTEEMVDTYTVELVYRFKGYLYLIGDCLIGDELSGEEVISYSIVEREERINDLHGFIAEALHDRSREHSVVEMKKDLEFLVKSDETYVLESVSTSGFLAADLTPREFNEACDEMLQQASDYYSEKVGGFTKTGKVIEDVTPFYSGEVAPDAVYEGEVVLIDDTLLGYELHIGMAVEKFGGKVPEGYVAAIKGTNGYYTLIEFPEQ